MTLGKTLACFLTCSTVVRLMGVQCPWAAEADATRLADETYDEHEISMIFFFLMFDADGNGNRNKVDHVSKVIHWFFFLFTSAETSHSKKRNWPRHGYSLI
jgi:hypothetical protein